MAQTISAMLAVLAALLLLRVGLGMSGFGPRRVGRRNVRVLESCPLGGRQRLLVVEVDGERLLLGAGDGPVSLIRSLASEPDVPERAGEVEPRSRAGLLRATRASWRALRRATPLVIAALLCDPTQAGAVPLLDESLLDGAGGLLEGALEPERLSSTLQIVVLLTLISVAPSILLMATCFTRVLIVLAFLRQAIGIQQLPPSQVLVGLALFMTFFVMAPVGQRIHGDALAPYMERRIDAPTAVSLALVPVREYLVEFTREEDLDLFASLAADSAEVETSEPQLARLLPAFMLSELRTAFEIGFMIYLPFLVIDLVIASMLISMGMIVLPPIVISLPFKLMLFVLLDGWNLVVASLLAGLR